MACALGLALAVLLLPTCGREPDLDAVVVRLVDAPAPKEQAPAPEKASIPYDQPKRLPLPEEIIGDERRYVLLPKATDPPDVELPACPECRRISRGPLTLPAGAFLEFGYGLVSQNCPRWASPVTFRIHAGTSGSNDAPALLFEQRLAPAADEPAKRWAEARVDLARFAGKTVVLTFEAEPSPGGRIQCPAVWGNPTIYRPARRPRNATNFILISIDTLRASDLGTYGYELPTSPFIDKLARDSAVVFENALTTSASTPQAHMSMFTGLYPSVHGITKGDSAMSSGLVTLTEILREAGYETGAVTEDGMLNAMYGFARGMNSFRENTSPNLLTPTGQVDLTVDEGLRWLRRNARKKFFLFLHTYQVHAPYAPPPLYEQLFVPYVQAGRTYPEPLAMPQNLRYKREYDLEIRYTDDQIARLFEGIRQLGLEGSTVVIITSDHGEEFLEHGYYEHGAHLYDHEILKVPLIVYGPGRIAAPRRIRPAVSLVDLTPTILELAGLPRLEGLQGLSLARVLTDPGAPPLPDRVLYAEAWGGALDSARKLIHWKRPTLAVRTSRYKYIMSRPKSGKGHRFELYDLAGDPGERHNRAGESPDPWPEGRRELEGYSARSAALQRALLQGTPVEGERRPVKIDPRREEKLRALGYIQ